MTKDEEKELAARLEQWFKENKYNPYAFNRNEVGILLKWTLKSWKHWKDLPRGDASKGGLHSKYGKPE